MADRRRAPKVSGRTEPHSGALRARPSVHSPDDGLPPGLHPVGPATASDGFLYVPLGYRPTTPAPLVLMLHGAGGDARNGLAPLLHLADSAGLVLLAPGSREETWDVIMGEYGPDVDFIDQLLGDAFRLCAIDPSRIAVEGFSDGASYALSLGVSNGALFTHIIAFSPGFIRPARQEGAPRVFVSHGKRDTVLPISRCSRQIVPQLTEAGYDVTYEEFDGGHTVPPEIASAAVAWFSYDPTVTARGTQD